MNDKFKTIAFTSGLGALGGLMGYNYNVKPRGVKIKEGEPIDDFKKRSITYDKKYKEYKRDRLISTISGALKGSIAGYVVGGGFKDHFKKRYSKYNQSYGGSSTKFKNFEDTIAFRSKLNSAKTKNDAKKIYREFAVKTHPDKGGKEEVFKTINNEWNGFRNRGNFDKLSFLIKKFQNKETKYGIEKTSSLINEVYLKSFINELSSISKK